MPHSAASPAHAPTPSRHCFVPPRLLPAIPRRTRSVPLVSCTRRQPTNWASRKSPPPPPRQPTEEQVVARITACARRRDWYAARCAWLVHVSHNEPSTRVVGAYVNALCRGRRLDDAYRLLETHEEFDGPVARTSVIGALTRSGRVDEGLMELRRCVTRGFDMSAPHGWTAVIHALGVEGRAEEAVAVLDEAIALRVRVDAGMYDAVIRAYGRVGMAREAFEVLGRLRADGLHPTECTFEGLIYACAHGGEGAGLGRKAFVIYDAAKEEGKAGVRVVNAVASAVLRARLGADDRVMQLLGEMEKIWDEVGARVSELGVDAERFERKLKGLRRVLKKEMRTQSEGSRENWADEAETAEKTKAGGMVRKTRELASEAEKNVRKGGGNSSDA